MRAAAGSALWRRVARRGPSAVAGSGLRLCWARLAGLRRRVSLGGVSSGPGGGPSAEPPRPLRAVVPAALCSSFSSPRGFVLRRQRGWSPPRPLRSPPRLRFRLSAGGLAASLPRCCLPPVLPRSRRRPSGRPRPSPGASPPAFGSPLFFAALALLGCCGPLRGPLRAAPRPLPGFRGLCPRAPGFFPSSCPSLTACPAAG